LIWGLQLIQREISPSGGGHSFSGASSTDGGIVIDLARHMKKVTVNPEEKTATVQAGARWIDVDEETAKFGLACVGGTQNDTGVAGVSVAVHYIVRAGSPS
jgi:FAD/FMN-containing dehydrogenase